MSNPIRALRLERGLSLQQLADAVGTSKSQIDKLEKGARRLTVDWMVRLARPLGCDPRDLIPALPMDKTKNKSLAPERGRGRKTLDLRSKSLGFSGEGEPKHVRPPFPLPQTPTLPVLSAARGGKDQEMFLDGGPVDRVPRPPYLEHVKDAYAVYVTGDSMAPMYRPRQMLFVHPHKPPSPGNGVVIVKKNGAVLIKEFVRHQRKSPSALSPAQARRAKADAKNCHPPLAGGSKALCDFGEGSTNDGRDILVVREYRPALREFTIPLADIESVHAVAGSTEP